MPACVQRGPGFGLAGAGDVRRGAEAEKDCEDGEADAAHGGGPLARDDFLRIVIPLYVFV
jgi:hypothetical protein